MALGYETDLRAMGEFSASELYAMLKMRVDVFVVEQKCPYPELDGKDPDALHLRLLSGNALLASARIFKPLHPGDAVSIGRVVVSPAYRGERLGEKLMKEAMAACERLFPGSPIALSAQSHLQRFYQSLGFSPVSEQYLEDAIPHIDMQLTAPARAA